MSLPECRRPSEERLEKLDLLVVGRPRIPTQPGCGVGGRAQKNGAYLCRPALNSRAEVRETASNRSLQWYDEVVKPIFETKDRR